MNYDSIYRRFLLVFGLCVPIAPALAAPTDIASGPLITPSASPVKPNLMFTLDDSGSMRWDYLPDWADDSFCRNSNGESGLKCCRRPSDGSSAAVCLPQNAAGNNIDTVYTGGTNQRGMPPFLTHTTWTLRIPAAGGGTRDEVVNGGFNSAYYNPTITYRPPVNADGSSRTSYSGTGTTPWDAYGVMYGAGGAMQGIDVRTEFPDTEWCTSTAFTDCLRADNYLVPGTISGKNYTTMRPVRATGTGNFVAGTASAPQIQNNRAAGPHYYVMIPGEFCTNRKLTHCVASWTPTTVGGVAYTYPAALRWCNNARGRDRRVDGATVAAAGDACQALRNGTFSSPRYPALRLHTAPLTYAPGRFMRIDIVSGKASYGNLCVSSAGTVTERFGACQAGEFIALDRSDRSDCTNRPNCSYSNELGNFANWFAWYRSRVQSAKSAVSIAFQSVDDRYRVGFLTINGATFGNRDLINIADFNFVPGTTTPPTLPSGNKQDWYTRLFAINPSGSTPLRDSLARAGRYFARQSGLTGATDPVQYSCQKNFSIVTTDGYWNSTGGVRLNNTAIGNEDNDAAMVIGGVTGPFADNWTGTLADVAAYYYKTDLRDTALGNCTGALGAGGGDVCTNNVPTTSGFNMNTAQHMATYGVSLGIDGLMQYRADYRSLSGDPTDDYDAVRNAVTASSANAANGICPWQTSGTCNWPQPAADSQANIDDLWHAAVNGHGSYLLAKDPLTLSRGLRDIIREIWVDDGSGAAATTSNPNVATGDNFVFSSKYWTQKWTGELVRESINTANGTIYTGSDDWQAHPQLDAASWSGRNIMTFKAGGGTPRAFTWTTLLNTVAGACNPPASEQGCFSQAWIAGGLGQYCSFGPICLSTADQAAAAGQPLVDYLRGDKSNEDTLSTTGFYRKRDGRLGDIVNAEAVYVGKYLQDYGSSVGYPARNTERSDPTLYVAANDGMLHAFNATGASSGGGQERWTYIPSMVIRDLYRLADKDYDTKHRYFVDGSPMVGDVKDGGSWKTILVGGLAGGGAGYYALDITNQASPQVLWEFRQKPGCTPTTPAGAARSASSGIARMSEDCDLGYSYGNPVITKLPSGQWVVMVTSGYNNHVNGDGRGYLYVLDAMTGAIVYKTTTGVGDSVTPSGFARIAAWADNPLKDNTTQYVYGGDLFGKLWRFDFTGGGVPVASLLYDAGPGKPIMARPELGSVTKANTSIKKRVVFFPTGRLLGNSDLANTQQQSFYGLWDWLGGAAPTSPLVTVNVSAGGAGRTGTIYDPNNDGKPDSVFDDDANPGWRLDFPDTGERGTTDPTLAFGTLVFSTTKPQSPDPCNPSGFTSWVYNIDYRSGHAVYVPGTSNNHVAVQYAGAATRPNVFTLPGGQVKSVTRVTDQNVTNQIDDVRTDPGSGKLKRVGWRELTK